MRVVATTLLALTFASPAFAKEKSKDLERIVAAAHAAFVEDDRGANADYIPALAEVDPNLWGVSLVTVDGRSFDLGDADVPFSIQSVSKAFVLAIAMQAIGEQAIAEKVGVDATGRPFNSVSAIEDMPERSVNSLVNAGAITTTGLLPGDSYDERWTVIESGLEAFAGRDLTVLQDVYESEAASNDHNQAIAVLLQSYGRFYSKPSETVDLYTKQCSVGVTSHDLAVMGATLANGGVNPITGAKVVDREHVPQVLAVMATAGLYENTGLWMYRVGLPAKSGVGGGIVAVAPGRFAVAAFSPRLDEAGNSVRAQEAIQQIAEALGANVFTP